MNWVLMAKEMPLTSPPPPLSGQTVLCFSLSTINTHTSFSTTFPLSYSLWLMYSHSQNVSLWHECQNWIFISVPLKVFETYEILVIICCYIKETQRAWNTNSCHCLLVMTGISLEFCCGLSSHKSQMWWQIQSVGRYEMF